MNAITQINVSHSAFAVHYFISVCSSSTSSMIPAVEIITPIRDLKLSREEEIAYLKSKGIEMNFEKAMYSINKGLWGTSVGGKETLNSKGMTRKKL